MIMISALMLIIAMFPLPAMAINVAISSVTPASKTGKVGDEVRIIGTTNTTNGLYRVWLGSDIVVNDTQAVGNDVNATFKVPQLPKGNHTLILQDITAAVNATSFFVVNTAYYIEARTVENRTLTLPAQLQENDRVRIWVNVTGAIANNTITANVTVTMPAPANSSSFSARVKINTSSLGTGNNLTTLYPSSNFQIGAHTNFTGAYSASFNKTLATTKFTIGLTNATEYHRFQSVGLRATGYKPTESVTMKILYGKTSMKKENLTADSGGIVNGNWSVPFNATIGTYSVNITSVSSTPSVKKVPDVQNFTIPGFSINMTTRNLAGEPVEGVTTKVFENGKFVNGTSLISDENGLVLLKLEIGSDYFANATYQDQRVAELPLNVTGPRSLNITCMLTNMRILVKSPAGLDIPEVKIFIKPQNLTLSTDVNGSAVAHSLLPNVTKPYVLNASRYDVSFNVTSVQTLLVNATAVAWYNITLSCPSLTLQMTIVNAVNQPVINATVKVQELIGGLFDQSSTDSSGKTTFTFAFGRYFATVYDPSGILLNQTTIDLFQNRNVTVVCSLYGLNVQIRVSDFFGQPISNAKVTLQHATGLHLQQTTQPDGTAIFNAITGGDAQVSVYLDQQAQPVEQRQVYLGASTKIDVKLGQYASIAGLLVETGQLITVLIIIITLAVIASIEVYRRRRVKRHETSEAEQE